MVCYDHNFLVKKVDDLISSSKPKHNKGNWRDDSNQRDCPKLDTVIRERRGNFLDGFSQRNLSWKLSRNELFLRKASISKQGFYSKSMVRLETSRNTRSSWGSSSHRPNVYWNEIMPHWSLILIEWKCCDWRLACHDIIWWCCFMSLLNSVIRKIFVLTSKAHGHRCLRLIRLEASWT